MAQLVQRRISTGLTGEGQLVRMDHPQAKLGRPLDGRIFPGSDAILVSWIE